MKRSIAVVVAVVALLFASAGPSGAGRGDDHNKKHKSERCHDDSCNGSGNNDCRNAKKKCSDDDLNINICVLTGSCSDKDKPGHDSGDESDEDEDEYADDEDEDEYADDKPDEEQEQDQPAEEEEEEEEDEYADEG